MITKTIFTLALALAISGLTAPAQEASSTTTPNFSAPSKNKGKGNHDGKRAGRKLFAALDANGDGTIDAAEIANAPVALKALDKNGDGTLTSDELQHNRAAGKEAKKEGKANKRNKKNGTAPAPATTTATPAAT